MRLYLSKSLHVFIEGYILIIHNLTIGIEDNNIAIKRINIDNR